MGGLRLAAAGLDRVVCSEALSVVGISEVFEKLPALWRGPPRVEDAPRLVCAAGSRRGRAGAHWGAEGPGRAGPGEPLGSRGRGGASLRYVGGVLSQRRGTLDPSRGLGSSLSSRYRRSRIRGV